MNTRENTRENNGRESSTKDSLNLLIYEYLFKNDFQKSAFAFKEECGISETKGGEPQDTLSSLYSCFVETVEVRSGQKISPDSLNRIEGIMMKMENEKNRYARLRSTVGCPSPRTRIDPRLAGDRDLYTPIGASMNSTSMNLNSPPHPVLVEIKRIDLGINTLCLSSFCPLNNILIAYSADSHVYFYNLATNEIEFDFSVPSRTLKNMKIRELEDSILIAYSCDDHSIKLCKYIYAKKEEIKTFEFDLPVRAFSLSAEALYILNDQGVKSYNFMGGCTGASKPTHAVSIECLGNRLLLIEPTKIVEFDILSNSETATFARCRFPIVKIKNSEAFLILNDSIQVIDSKVGTVVASVKSTLPCRDVALLSSTIAVCTQSDLFFASDIIPVKNPIEISCYNCMNTKGLLLVTSEGIIVLYNKVGAYE